MSNMSTEKEHQVLEFKNWLMSCDFHFLEKANGHFQVLDDNNNKVKFQIWPTTQKMLDANGCKYMGIDNIRNTLYTWKFSPTQPSILCSKPARGDISIEDKKVKCPGVSSSYKLEGRKEEKSELRINFEEVYKSNKGTMYDCTLVLALYMPNGATNIIVISYEVESTMKQYLEEFDNQFREKLNPNIKLIGFMLV